MAWETVMGVKCQWLHLLGLCIQGRVPVIGFGSSHQQCTVGVLITTHLGRGASEVESMWLVFAVVGLPSDLAIMSLSPLNNLHWCSNKQHTLNFHSKKKQTETDCFRNCRSKSVYALPKSMLRSRICNRDRKRHERRILSIEPRENLAVMTWHFWIRTSNTMMEEQQE